MKNREIKFRAFCKDTNKMLYLPDIYFTSNGREFQVVDRRTQFVIENKFVMQFTGLKDKNGIEIYEGDIVRIRTPYRSTQTHIGDNIPLGSYTEPLEPEIKEEIETVEFSNSCFNIGAYDEYCPKFLCYYVEKYDLQKAQELFCGGWNEYGSKFTWNDIDDGDLQYLLETYKLNSEVELLQYLGLEVIGNIFENKDLLP